MKPEENSSFAEKILTLKKDLSKKILTLKKELFMIRIKRNSENSTNFKDYKKKKKEVARMLTLINNKRH